MTSLLSRGLMTAVIGLGATVAQAALPTSGTCGFVGELPMLLSYVYSRSSTASHAVSVMGTLTFASSGQVTLGLNMAYQNIRSTQATQDTPSEDCTIKAGNNACTTQGSAKLKFKGFTALSTTVPGAYTAKVADPSMANAFITLNLLPVNNGRTVLMQWLTSDDEQARIATCQF